MEFDKNLYWQKYSGRQPFPLQSWKGLVNIQNASNMRGVISTLHDCAIDLERLLDTPYGEYNLEWMRQHPSLVCIMFKLTDMAGIKTADESLARYADKSLGDTIRELYLSSRMDRLEGKPKEDPTVRMYLASICLKIFGTTDFGTFSEVMDMCLAADRYAYMMSPSKPEILSQDPNNTQGCDIEQSLTEEGRTLVRDRFPWGYFPLWGHPTKGYVFVDGRYLFSVEEMAEILKSWSPLRKENADIPEYMPRFFAELAEIDRNLRTEEKMTPSTVFFHRHL